MVRDIKQSVSNALDHSTIRAARFHKFNVYVTYFILLHSGLQTPAIHELVFNSIKQCGIDMRRNLFANIILSGGSTLFPGKVVAFNSLIQVCLYVRMYVCVCVCVYYVRVYMRMCVCLYLSIYACTCMCVCGFAISIFSSLFG